MNINGKHYRTIWLKEDNPSIVQIIDHRFLPHQFVTEELKTVQDVAVAIKDMHIKGAGLIGVTAGYGMYIAALGAPKNNEFDRFIFDAAAMLKATRPTAVNLTW